MVGQDHRWGGIHPARDFSPASSSRQSRTSQRASYADSMPADQALQALDSYVEALSSAAERTQQTEDRPRYRDHLAAAAVLFHLLYQNKLAEAKKVIAQEERSYGWSFLVGAEGAVAESAFAAFARTIRQTAAG